MLDDVHWDMFRSCADNIDKFADVVNSFINMLANDIIPMATVTTFVNWKPWVDGTIHKAVNSRMAAYNTGLTTGDMSTYKAASYRVQCAVKLSKEHYIKYVQSYFH